MADGQVVSGAMDLEILRAALATGVAMRMPLAPAAGLILEAHPPRHCFIDASAFMGSLGRMH